MAWHGMAPRVAVAVADHSADVTPPRAPHALPFLRAGHTRHDTPRWRASPETARPRPYSSSCIFDCSPTVRFRCPTSFPVPRLAPSRPAGSKPLPWRPTLQTWGFIGCCCCSCPDLDQTIRTRPKWQAFLTRVLEYVARLPSFLAARLPGAPTTTTSKAKPSGNSGACQARMAAAGPLSACVPDCPCAPRPRLTALTSLGPPSTPPHARLGGRRATPDREPTRRDSDSVTFLW